MNRFTREELAAMREAQEAAMQDRCRILRWSGHADSLGERVDTWTPDAATTPCGFGWARRTEALDGDKTVVRGEFLLRLPHGTVIDPRDRVQIVDRFGEGDDTQVTYDIDGEPAVGPVRGRGPAQTGDDVRLTVTIRGDDVLRRRLRALGDVARGQVIMDAVEAGGRVLEAEAKLLAPWDLGALRASIDTVRDGVTATGAYVRVGPAVHYAPFVEFGTGIHAEGGGGRRTPWVYFNNRLGRFVRTVGSPAQPYLRPALRQRKSAIVAAIGATLRRLLDAARRR